MYQAKYLYSFMKVFEILISFIRASRQNDWNLHLVSLNDFCKCFFAHDQLNYAGAIPLYLANMTKLKTSDYENCQKREQNFSIINSKIPSGGPVTVHSLEQENKVMKVSAGLIGLTQNQEVLNQFCLIAPILSSLTYNHLEKL